MSSTAAVQIRGLTKKFGSKTIVDNLSFDIPKGEVFGFLGPNGAGKTTTIRMMVGLMGMNAGQVLINGIDVSKHFEEAMRHVGAIVENPEMYKYLSGYQNLAMYARMNRDITKERIDEVVAFVGLEHSIRAKVKTYSLGMRQRLGLAQALLHKPSVLILDEPTNGLDPAGIRELRDHLRKLAEQEGVAVVVSSHLLSEMELMCDRVAIIQNGKLVDVQQLRSDAVAEQTITVLFEVEENAAATAELTLSQASGVEEVVTKDGLLQVLTTREQIPGLNELLVQAGIKVYGIRTASKTLEDKFLEVTGGAVGV